MNDHSRDSRDDEDYMTDEGDANGDLDCLEATPVLICHVGTEERHDIGPKCIARNVSCEFSLRMTRLTKS